MMKIDDLFSDHIGQFGRYQKFVVACFTMGCVIYSFFTMDMIFTGAVPLFRCKPPRNLSLILQSSSLEKDNLTWMKPIEENGEKHDACKAFDVDVVFNGSKVPGNTTVQACGAFEYDTSEFKSTTVTEWDLVCDREWLVATAQTVVMAGNLAGVLLSGILSDRFGRRIVFASSIAIATVFKFFTAFSPNYIVYVATKFVTGACTIALYSVGFILGTELVGPDWKVFVGVVTAVAWSVGFLLLPGLAFLIRSRMTLELVIASFGLPFLLIYWVIPESPRWLVSQGRQEEAESVLRNIARYNKVKIPDILKLQEERETLSKKPEENKESLMTLINKFHLLIKYIGIAFIWVSLALAYYGITLNVGNMAGNIYLNTFISGAVEMPAYMLNQYALASRLGRKTSLIISFLLSAILLLSIMAVPENHGIITTILGQLGKGSVSFSFGAVYIYTAELYPTCIRNAGLGISSTMARVGGVIAPFVARLGQHSAYIPSIMFGSFSLASACILIFLPETRGKPLPQTISEAEHLMRLNICSAKTNLTRKDIQGKQDNVV